MQGRQSHAIPWSENQFDWFPMNSSLGPKTEDSWAPLHSSHIYFIQRIMVVAKIFSTRMKASWSVPTHFSPRNRCQITTLLLFSPSVYAKREEACLGALHPFSTFQGTHSAPPLLPFWPTLRFGTCIRTAEQPLSRQTRTGLKSHHSIAQEGDPLSSLFTSL